MKRTRIRNTDNYQCKTELRLIRYLFLKKMSIHKYVYPCFVCMATQLLYYVSPPGNRNADSPLGSAETGSGAKECGQSGRGEKGGEWQYNFLLSLHFSSNKSKNTFPLSQASKTYV